MIRGKYRGERFFFLLEKSLLSESHQHVLDLWFNFYTNQTYCVYWSQLGMSFCVQNPSFRELAEIYLIFCHDSSSTINFGPRSYIAPKCPEGLCWDHFLMIIQFSAAQTIGGLGALNWKSLTPSLRKNTFSLFFTDNTFSNSEWMSVSIAQVIYSSYLRLNSKFMCHW